MKYIRTKDGIYLNGGEFGYPRVGIIGKKQENDFGFCFDKTDVVKQADTIKELCDEFIGLSINNIHNFYDSFEEMKQAFTKYKNEIFYGAIWTDKGLIYVAKMNEKGELCLI